MRAARPCPAEHLRRQDATRCKAGTASLRRPSNNHGPGARWYYPLLQCGPAFPRRSFASPAAPIPLGSTPRTAGGAARLLPQSPPDIPCRVLGVNTTYWNVHRHACCCRAQRGTHPHPPAQPGNPPRCPQRTLSPTRPGIAWRGRLALVRPSTWAGKMRCDARLGRPHYGVHRITTVGALGGIATYLNARRHSWSRRSQCSTHPRAPAQSGHPLRCPQRTRGPTSADTAWRGPGYVFGVQRDRGGWHGQTRLPVGLRTARHHRSSTVE